MKRVKIKFLFLFLLFPAYSYAQVLPCSSEVIGKKIFWESNWSKDNKDGGIEYILTRANRINNNQSILFEFHSSKMAFKKERQILANSRRRQNKICDLLLGEEKNNEKRFKDDFASKVLKGPDKNLASLQYIKYGKTGWVKADLNSAGKSLVVCKIASLKFSCLERDKKAHLEELEELEKELIFMSKLGY